MYATIEPVSVYPSTASMLCIPEVMLQNLGVATRNVVTWTLCTAEAQSLTQGTLTMSAEEYALWGTDDTYVFTWVAAQLGLTILSIVDLPFGELAPAAG